MDGRSRRLQVDPFSFNRRGGDGQGYNLLSKKGVIYEHAQRLDTNVKVRQKGFPETYGG